VSGATVDRVKRDQFGIPRVLRPVPGAWWERAYAVPEAVPADRRATLISQPAGENYLRFDIVMQGTGETVFFDL